MNDKELPFQLSVRALVTNRDGEYLVLKRSPGSRYWPLQWDLPGGAVRTGENFEQALLREAKEETGLDVALTGVAGAFELDHHLYRIAVLVMTAAAVAGEVRLGHEHVEYGWVPPGALPDIGLLAPLAGFLSRNRPAPPGN